MKIFCNSSPVASETLHDEKDQKCLAMLIHGCKHRLLKVYASSRLSPSSLHLTEDQTLILLGYLTVGSSSCRGLEISENGTMTCWFSQIY